MIHMYILSGAVHIWPSADTPCNMISISFTQDIFIVLLITIHRNGTYIYFVRGSEYLAICRHTMQYDIFPYLS